MKTRTEERPVHNGNCTDVVIPVYRPDEKLRKIIEMLGKQTVSIGKLILMVTEDQESFELKDFLPEAKEPENKNNECNCQVSRSQTCEWRTDKATGPSSRGISNAPAAPAAVSAQGNWADTNEQAGNFSESSLQTASAGGFEIEVHRLKKSEFNHGLTRNAGVRCSEAKVVVLMTDDAVPNDCYLIEQLLSGLSEENTAVCYARQLAGEDADLAERFSREYNYPPESRRKTSLELQELGIKTFFCSNVCAAYNRQVFDELGGFTETIFNEDMIFARKALNAGYAIKYQAEAKVIHSHRFTNREQFRRNYDLAVSQKLHPETFSDVSSEKEGFRYVGKAYSYFRANKRGLLIVPFAVTCGFRFLGYRAGKMFGKKRIQGV
ncbi:MAG: glycosyltransferase [Lachnospiraceae bacterium]|nr:glycosyltransferase [Lachnospiraceae bacterium]